MARETSKKKNSKAVNRNNNKSADAANVTNKKKEDRGTKRTCPADYDENDQPQFIKRQSTRSASIKSVVKSSVINAVNRTLGLSSASIVSNFHKEVIKNQIKRFHVSKGHLCPFDRRVTAMTWHPKYPKIFATGSKGGDLLLHNLNGGDDYFRPGVGPGGSILGLKFSYEDPYSVYTASLTGKIHWINFQKGEKSSKLLFSSEMCYDNWFTCLDSCNNRKILLTGDCKGCAYLLSSSGKLIWQKKKLHNSKITHCEFNIHDPNVFLTSSIDHTVKLWDLRAVSESKEKRCVPLAEFPHNAAVNSAYFSPSNGTNILTTDQCDELRVYSSPLWREMLTITHPHRQFQHMTQIKAIWHPLEDIIVVGRYPDDRVQMNDSRTIDFYDGSNGELLHQILSPTNLIVSLNAMNSTGEDLASAGGCGIVFMKDELSINEDETKPETDKNSKDTSSHLNKKKNKNAAYKTSSKVNKVKKKLEL